jgi:predicted nucleic acid-binding protein
MPAVCLDASMVLLWLLEEDLSAKADARLNEWRDAGTEFVSHHLLSAEVPSVLRQAVHGGRISVEEGDEAFESFVAMDIRTRQPDRLVRRAWELGKALNASKLYDMCYLALAELEQCELWTADRRLANLAGQRTQLVHWVGE